MKTPRKQSPFILRVAVFTVIYMLIALVAEWGLALYRGNEWHFDAQKLQQYFLIGICISVAMLLLSGARRSGLPPKR